jgi:ubiquinone/menaquinone biosynthesis C-methylase UbiE
VNVDALPAWHVHYICAMDDLRPFRDDSVDLVYASHCLEHISHLRVNAVLTEWRRVLKAGGVLRLGVPDFDQIVALYDARGRDIEAIQEILMGGQTYRLNAHFTAFTRQSLTDRLLAVGFTQVRPWERNTDELTSLPDFTGLTATVGDRSIPLSLNLEAVK